MSVDTFAKGALFCVGLFWGSVNKVFLREMKVKLGKCAAAQFSVLFYHTLRSRLSLILHLFQ